MKLSWTVCRVPAQLTAEQTLNVTRSVKEMNDFNSIALWQVEDQPVLEAFHRPAAQTTKRWPMKSA